MKYKKLITELQNGELQIDKDCDNLELLRKVLSDAAGLKSVSDLKFYSIKKDMENPTNYLIMSSNKPFGLPIIIKLSTIKLPKEPKMEWNSAVEAVRSGSHSVTWDKGDKSSIVRFLKDAFPDHTYKHNEDKLNLICLNSKFRRNTCNRNSWVTNESLMPPTIKLSEIKKPKSKKKTNRELINELRTITKGLVEDMKHIKRTEPTSEALNFDMPKGEEPKAEICICCGKSLS